MSSRRQKLLVGVSMTYALGVGCGKEVQCSKHFMQKKSLKSFDVAPRWIAWLMFS